MNCHLLHGGIVEHSDPDGGRGDVNGDHHLPVLLERPLEPLVETHRRVVRWRRVDLAYITRLAGCLLLLASGSRDWAVMRGRGSFLWLLSGVDAGATGFIFSSGIRGCLAAGVRRQPAMMVVIMVVEVSCGWS